MIPIFSFNLRLLRLLQFELVTGPAAATTAEGTIVPAGRVWLIISATASHTEVGVAHEVRLSMRFPSTQELGIATTKNGNSTIRLCPDRPFLLAAGFRMVAGVDAIGALAQVQLAVGFYDLILPSPGVQLEELWTLPKPTF